MAEKYPVLEKLEKKFYKTLVTDLARELTEKEIKEVAFQHSIEANHYKDALDLFTVLEKRNIIGNSKPISELAQIFENIQRNDLVTKVYETATKMQGRVSQSLKLPQPERTINQLQKRSNTVSGVPLNEIEHHHQQETQECTEATPQYEFSGHDDAFLPKLESSSQVLLEVTHDHEHSTSYDIRSEASIPSSGNRSRHISEHISPWQGQYPSSRSGTHSPSLHNTTSASGCHSISDLSTVSTHAIPQTEYERNYVLMNKFLDLLHQKPSIAKRIVSESDADQDYDSATDKLLTFEAEPTKKAAKPKVGMASKRQSQTESERTLVSSFDSCCKENDSEMAASSVSPLGTRKPHRSRSYKLSKLLQRIGRVRSTNDSPNSVQWLLKRDQLNKIICRHQENKIIHCKRKIEVDVGNGSTFNPQLTLVLRPYGVEEDVQKYVTLEVHINVPKRAPKLKAATNVKLILTVSRLQSEDNTIIITENLDLRVFYKKKFISHTVLRESRSETVEITARAECIKPMV